MTCAIEEPQVCSLEFRRKANLVVLAFPIVLSYALAHCLATFQLPDLRSKFDYNSESQKRSVK